MASRSVKLVFRLLLVAAAAMALYYVGRPLYWKISATVHDIRHNKQTVSGGISKIVEEAQKSVGWFHDESDSGLQDDKKSVSARRFLLGQVMLDSQIGCSLRDTSQKLKGKEDFIKDIIVHWELWTSEVLLVFHQEQNY
ncbi:uncharacterized protein LOC142556457 isoform X2 [Primulina tabacum]|uniref:uncharacterized protein LOC142556457 isoform X2 n=1 Tax=Primulina tabacum TaxID=48773 RepID=UPI003F5ADA2B